MEKQLDDEKAKTTKLEQDLQRWKVTFELCVGHTIVLA